MLSDHILATGRLGNPASFEAFPDFLARERADGSFCRLLDGFPQGTVWLYRSSDMHGTNSYARMNSCFWVLCPARFPDAAAARRALDETGLVPILEREKGSALLISPIGDDWAQADLDCFLKLQRASLDVMSDRFGAFGMNYVIGIGAGADFIHNFIANCPECSSKIAAALAVGGSYDPEKARLNSSLYGIETVAFPMWLSGCDASVGQMYRALSGFGDAVQSQQEDRTVFTSAAQPMLQLVCAPKSDAPLGALITQIYRDFLRRRIRIPIAPGRNSFLDSPCFALGERYFADALGLAETAHENGEPLPGTDIRRWYEYVPQELLGTAEKKTPLILLLHGHCDDPRALMEQCGFLKLAGDERLAVVAPDHQRIDEVCAADLESETNKVHMFDRLVAYMLEKYPFLDPTRVYCTGFSRGGMNTCAMSFFDTGRFAATAPLSGLALSGMKPETALSVAQWEAYVAKRGIRRSIGLPAYILVCGRDNVFSDRFGLRARLKLQHFGAGRQGGAADALNVFRLLNGLPELPASEYDFARFPFWGFPLADAPADATPDVLIRHGDLPAPDGRPALRFAVAEGMEHALYYAYARNMWAFCRRFSRDPVTGEIRYDAQQ